MRRVFSLDERLKAVYSLYPKCALAADIGSDHGKLPCKLLIDNICDKMIISDISEQCLIKARGLIKSYSLDEKTIFKVADGLKAIDTQVDCISITGIGGFTISEIIKSLPELNCHPKLILSAHTDLIELRKALINIDYIIDREKIVICKNRFYTILVASKSDERMSEKDILIGRNIFSDSVEVINAYLMWLKKTELVKLNRNNLLLKYIEEELSNASSKNM